ncbi:MAG: hypothetical protein HQL54_14670 [Magnetococcales bacterium]|nr:hypothetical protein [Magnetococcales bacterium]
MNIIKKIDFGNEAGDDESPDTLMTYFVEQHHFKNFLREDKMMLATSKKGVGKSALIQWIYSKRKNDSPDDLIIKIRGSDLSRSNFDIDNSLKHPNDYIFDWQQRISTLINRYLARKIKFAFKDDSISIIEKAELEGFKERNLLGSLLERFERLATKGKKIKPEIGSQIERLKRVKKKNVWVLIDDLDATFQHTDSECLELGTFFTACRYLIQDMEGLFFRVTMRTDVWPLIRRYDESVDKMEQYVYNINWDLEDFKILLFNRIKAQLDLLKISYRSDAEEFDIINKVFIPKMDWNQKKVSSYSIVHTLSYRRPRWAIQLCKIAQENAIKTRSEFITKTHIDNVWGEFGKQRIADLVAEHKHQCKEVEELITAFRNSDRRLTRDELMSLINRKIKPHINTYIEGKYVNDAVSIARFLFRIGFIQARAENDGEFEHYDFSSMPNFLSTRTDDDFGVKWEIHPCYREALDIRKISHYKRRNEGYFR